MTAAKQDSEKRSQRTSSRHYLEEISKVIAKEPPVNVELCFDGRGRLLGIRYRRSTYRSHHFGNARYETELS